MNAYCAHCGEPLPPNAAFCPNCRQTVPDTVPTQPEPHLLVIALMWLLTFGYFCFLSAKSAGMASLCGVSSFGMGIYLVTRPNGTDKVNGWIRLGIGIVMGLIYFAQATQRV